MTRTAAIMTAVALARALEDVRTFLRRFVVLTDDQATTIALWVAHTHAIAAAECTPYLQITSAMKQAGKTRLLEVLEPLVANPWLTGRTSPAALVRKIDAEHPTLLLDESDAAFQGEKEYAEALRGLLNTGYRASGRTTLCIGQGAKITVRDFATFCPKAIAGIGRSLPGTVADRAIPILLKRRKADEPCDRWRQRDGHRAAAPLRDALAVAVAPLLAGLTDARPALPPTLTDRQQDVWEPLLALADAAGGDWPTQARRAAGALAASLEDDDILVELLRDVAAFLDDELAPADTWIATNALLTYLTAQPDRPWATWSKGGEMTPHALRKQLAPLDIRPDRGTGANQVRTRGYRRDAFQDAIARYLPSYVSMCPSPNETGSELAFSMCPPADPLDTSKIEKSPITTGAGTHGHLEAGGQGAGGLLPALHAAVAAAPQTVVQLATVVDLPVEVVETFVRAHGDTFERLTRTADGVHRIALVRRGPAA